MAVVDINSTVKKWQNGGKLQITDGSTVHNLLNVDSGSIEIRAGIRDRMIWRDRGVIQTPIVTDDQLTELRFRVFAGSLVATALLGVLMAAGTADAVKVFDNFIVDIAASRGGSTGEKLTQTSCWLAEAPVHRTGDAGSPDTVEFVLQSKTLFVGFVAY